jgi:hypothetical protein
MHEGDAQNPDVARIWQTKLPGKLQIFGWLLLHGRLNTRANLHYKNIRQRDEANCEYCHNILETDEHIFNHCSRARLVWAALGINLINGTHKKPWLLGTDLPLPDQVRTDVALTIL